MAEMLRTLDHARSLARTFDNEFLIYLLEVAQLEVAELRGEE